MSRLVRAELYWQLHRRPLRLAALLAATCAVALPGARQVFSSTDVGAAVQVADREAAEALARGVEIPREQLYVEPRYELASQLPTDVAALALGVALVVLITAAVAVGGEWRSGTVRLSFPSLGSRSAATTVRVLAWSAAGCAIGAASMAACCVGLLAVGHLGGLADGLSVADAAGVGARGTLLVTAAGALGAAVASTTRSDVVVVTGTLVYVLVAEILVVGLLMGQEYQSPGARVLMSVAGTRPGVSREVEIDCSPAPRCSVTLETGWETAGTYGVAVVCLVAVTALAAWSARRPWWT